MNFHDDLPLLISPSRLSHVKRVSEAAAQLALRWNVPTDEATLAGLLHDCAKQLTPSELTQQGIDQPSWSQSLYTTYPAIWHAFVGPTVARQKWGIRNPRVLGAMKWHSTGRAAMTPLDQILFIADYIEPERKFPTRAYVETLAYQDLTLGAYAVVYLKLFFLLRHHRRIHPDAFRCREYLLDSIPESQLHQVHEQLWPLLLHA